MESMVEIFKTNVNRVTDSKAIVFELMELLPDNFINFDLEDCDRILRVEGITVEISKIIEVLRKKGFTCEPFV